MLRSLLPSISLVIFACCAFSCQLSVIAAEKRKSENTEDVAKLKRENDTLRSENQRLRRMLAESLARTSPPAEKPPKEAKTEAPRVESESGFWLSDNGKRHNARCNYYRVTKGRPCDAKEGTACKICGG